IMGALHPAPNARPITKKLAKPDGHGGGYRLALRKNVVGGLAGGAPEGSNLRLGFSSCRGHPLAKRVARGGRTPVRITFGGILGHGAAPQWYCSKSTRKALLESNSKGMHHGPLT